MLKMSAPHPASWRGRAIAAGEAIDVPENAAAELAAHGFREKGDVAPAQSADDDIDALPRKELLKRLRGKGLGNLFVLGNDELRALARCAADREYPGPKNR